MRRRRNLEIIAGTVSGGTPAAIIACTDPGVSVVRTGVGSYTLTFPAGFRAQSMSGNGMSSRQVLAVQSVGLTATVTLYDSVTGNVTDTNFSFVAVGLPA